MDGSGARIVADQLECTKEMAFDPTGRWLYVNETFGRWLSRFAMRPDGGLALRETVTESGRSTFPDEVAFDEEGFAWLTSIVSNPVIQVARTARTKSCWKTQIRATWIGWSARGKESRWSGNTWIVSAAGAL